jgi:arylsulfatase A-like enzyme
LFGDHGWSLGEKHHWRKFALWEEPTRAPFIWVAPGVTRAGTTSSRTVDFMSIYPTLADLCGLSIPAHVEGKSIRTLLVDPSANWGRAAVTTHGRENHAVRTAQWRYIRYQNGNEELYDETKDPYEWTNLAGDKRYDTLKAELAEFFPKINNPAPDSSNPRRGEVREQ